MPELLHRSLDEATIPELQAAMKSGKITSRKLIQVYISRIGRIDKGGPRLNSVAEVNPDALGIASQLDEERMEKGPRGPLHGIPVILKDIIAFNEKHKQKELKYFGQDLFLKAQKTPGLKDRKYLKALKKDRLLISFGQAAREEHSPYAFTTKQPFQRGPD